MFRRALLVTLMVVAGCAKQVPVAEVREPVDAGPVAEAPPAPKVELPPAPALPLPPTHLSANEDSADNPTTPEKAALGHQLFFDKRLSKDDSMACANCHLADHGWATGNAFDAKVGGAMNKRHTPTVLNLAWHSTFYWDGRMPTLEAVSNAAWKGQLGAEPAAVAAKLNAVPTYDALFHRAFKESATSDNVPKALAAFLRSLKSGNSPWDKFEAGDAAAVSAEAKRGFEVFKKAGCVACHVPPLYTDFDFHQVGVGMEKPEAERDNGRKDATKKDEDFGKFKTPSLRNVAVSAPYFHDGRAATLDEAIDFMAQGFSKYKGVDAKLKVAKLSKQDKAALKAFLTSLSGESTYSGAPTLP